LDKTELCDGCPCIGLCKPECGVYSYTFNKKQCQQCGCRESTSVTEEPGGGGDVLCNGCPCIGVCRSDCGLFSYEYKKNVMCQQCGCKYQDTLLKDVVDNELSLIDQVLHILKSLGVIFYKPGKPIKPIIKTTVRPVANTTRSTFKNGG
jgi:hypothetical protein